MEKISKLHFVSFLLLNIFPIYHTYKSPVGPIPDGTPINTILTVYYPKPVALWLIGFSSFDNGYYFIFQLSSMISFPIILSILGLFLFAIQLLRWYNDNYVLIMSHTVFLLGLLPIFIYLAFTSFNVCIDYCTHGGIGSWFYFPYFIFSSRQISKTLDMSE